MSAFIVSRECMDTCVYAFVVTLDLDTREDPDKLGRKLYALNRRAMRERYGAGEGSGGERYKYATGAGFLPPSLAQQIKALQCLQYQCAEGTVPKSALYKRIDRAIKDLSVRFVQHSPEWGAASWG